MFIDMINRKRCTSYALFMLINGLAGYFASRGTKVSLLVAILFGILFSLLVLGVD
jgi:uncharacterized membrane protein (UPF0136 family)